MHRQGRAIHASRFTVCNVRRSASRLYHTSEKTRLLGIVWQFTCLTAMSTLSFSGMVQRGQTAETTNRHFPTVCSPRVNIPTYGRGHTTLKTAEIALVWHNFDSPVTSTPVRRRPSPGHSCG